MTHSHNVTVFLLAHNVCVESVVDPESPYFKYDMHAFTSSIEAYYYIFFKITEIDSYVCRYRENYDLIAEVKCYTKEEALEWCANHWIKYNSNT